MDKLGFVLVGLIVSPIVFIGLIAPFLH